MAGWLKLGPTTRLSEQKLKDFNINTKLNKMTERTIKIKGLISGQVDMGTFGLVELELLAIEKEMEALRQPPVSGQVCGCSTPKFYQESYHYRKCEHCGKREYPQTLR